MILLILITCLLDNILHWDEKLHIDRSNVRWYQTYLHVQAIRRDNKVMVVIITVLKQLSRRIE